MNGKSSPSAIVDRMPEVFVSRAEISAEVSRRVGDGRLRKLATRLYTRDMAAAPEALVRRNLWGVVGGYFPGALLADRTALEFEPAPDGSICLVAARGANIDLPGVRLRPRRGTAPQPDDRPFLKGLFLSSAARACLDNLRSSRERAGRVSRTLRRAGVEEHLERVIATSGANAARRLRDDARRIATVIDRVSECAELDEIVGAMVGTRDARLRTPAARARAIGRPYDQDRLELFGQLHGALMRTPHAAQPTRRRDGVGAATLAFFDAYFSNYIEGTEFATDEASAIVFEGRIPSDRPADAHDILGVWSIVSDASEMRRVPDSENDFLGLLRDRHARMLEARPEVGPGSFKAAANRVGSIEFVHPDAVLGTLERAFVLYRSLDTPFRRAAFMEFVVSEVHPFTDGNGRMARLMMNAELIAADQERIVIPTVYRDNYIAAQRALTSGRDPEPLQRTLDYAWRWTAAVPWRNVKSTEAVLRACHAFDTPGEAERRGVRLRIPPPSETPHGP